MIVLQRRETRNLLKAGNEVIAERNNDNYFHDQVKLRYSFDKKYKDWLLSQSEGGLSFTYITFFILTQSKECSETDCYFETVLFK